jgi:hypothetical protein
MSQQPAEGAVPQGFRFRLDWRVADGFPISYANQFMVQVLSDEFVITLGQIAPPAVVNPTREEVEALPKTISPMVVARVAVTPSGHRQLIELLQQQLNRYESGDVRDLSDRTSDVPDDGKGV